jgi:hypothetical protein
VKIFNTSKPHIRKTPINAKGGGNTFGVGYDDLQFLDMNDTLVVPDGMNFIAQFNNIRTSPLAAGDILFACLDITMSRYVKNVCLAIIAIIAASVWLVSSHRDSTVPSGFEKIEPSSKDDYLTKVTMIFGRNASVASPTQTFNAEDINRLARVRHDRQSFDAYAFRNIDTDRDGLISETEIMADASLWDGGLSPLSKLDTDKDGRVSESEWNAVPADEFPSNRGAEWRRYKAFMMSLVVLTKLVDWSVDRDVVITKAGELFDRADVNGDGAVDIAEAQSWSRSLCVSSEMRHRMFQPVLCQRGYSDDCHC